jgi:hypothetical protein
MPALAPPLIIYRLLHPVLIVVLVVSLGRVIHQRRRAAEPSLTIEWQRQPRLEALNSAICYVHHRATDDEGAGELGNGERRIEGQGRRAGEKIRKGLNTPLILKRVEVNFLLGWVRDLEG